MLSLQHRLSLRVRKGKSGQGGGGEKAEKVKDLKKRDWMGKKKSGMGIRDFILT